MFELKPITNRVQKLRDMYRNTIPSIDAERTGIITEYYKKSRNVQLVGIQKHADSCPRVLCFRLDKELQGSKLPLMRQTARYEYCNPIQIKYWHSIIQHKAHI